ncbi:hypothetical protein [Noviherbaspirillum massiliense]|uniref:hypothetical protein n=1 Tax=Noviherbaspirillum massiliense TaxID=1465823 RepID=UPI0011DDB91C|nr:hypothetical protein [Noviherbaspirillum massiliense]
MKLISRSMLLALFALALGMPAAAQHDRGEHSRNGPRPERGEHGRRVVPWHGDIHRFHDRDLPFWRGGRWVHGRHGAHEGWWWVVGPTWYWYPAPVYPYPDPYLPPPAALITPPEPAAQPQYWYYCVNPPGYYPYVPQCNGNWERVPATPPPPPPR